MWGGRFAAPPSALLRALNDSFAFDRELFAEDVEGSIAWARALARAGVLTPTEAETIVNGLVSVPAPQEAVEEGRGPRDEGREGSAESTPTSAHSTRPSALGPQHSEVAEGGKANGESTPTSAHPTRPSALGPRPSPEPSALGTRPSPEDVHSYVEAKLYDAIGPLAGKLHTGRSRNDQVATDLKLWLRRACDEATGHLHALAHALATRALAEAATVMPGYTHSKQAEPITFGHWCLAYCEMLARDASRLLDTRARGNECPLGSGALAGTPLPIDRDALAEDLGFDQPTDNSLDSVSDRDFAAEYLFVASLLLTHLSRLAEDLIFFTSDECAYAELPDSMATGSSRMPQKKNPDVLELARGYAARGIGELTGFLALLKGLPLAYDKDLQLDKEPLFRTRLVIGALLPALTALVNGLQLDRERMRNAASSDALMATAVADAIAAKGVPFREAHEQVSRNLANLGEMLKEHGVTLESIVAKKSAHGGTSPERVKEQAEEILEALAGDENPIFEDRTSKIEEQHPKIEDRTSKIEDQTPKPEARSSKIES